jgi:hypothetical protein
VLRGPAQALLRTVRDRRRRSGSRPLGSAPDKGREAVSAYLLHTPKNACPESLTADLHRIERLERPIGQDALLAEARRRCMALVPSEVVAKTTARNLALRAFVDHPEIFEEAEIGLAFLQPQSVTEFVAPEEDIPADVGNDKLRELVARAREIFQADLRDEFCEAHTHSTATRCTSPSATARR